MNTISRGLLFFALLLSKALPAQQLRYQISPDCQPDGAALQVCLQFVGDADGETEIALPGDYGSATKLFRAIRDLRCVPSDCQLTIGRDSLTAIIRHRPAQSLRLGYSLRQDFPGSEPTNETAFRPIVQPGFFHVLGSTLFLVPKGREGCEVRLDWRNFPAGWALHNSFGTQETTQQFKSASLHWLESVFVGGDFRLLKTSVRNCPVWLALRGKAWAFSDADLLEMLRRTVEVQRAFWHDFDIPFYTVTLMPLALESGAEGPLQYLGTGLQNSFAAFATPVKQLDVKGLQHLFNHELMHDWLGSKIRNGGTCNDMTFSWFSEGFTEYFAYKNMLAAGFITPDEYLETLNRDFFAAHYASRVAEVPNSEIQRNFFNKSDVSQLPYKRGCLFAFYLDNLIKTRSGGTRCLHDFMLEMLDYYYEGDKDLLTGFDFFEKNMGKYLPPGEFSAMYRAHIVEGRFIPAEKFVLPDFLEMTKNAAGVPVVRQKIGQERQGGEQLAR